MGAASLMVRRDIVHKTKLRALPADAHGGTCPGSAVLPLEGVSAAVACPLFSELYSPGRVRAISAGRLRALALWSSVSGLSGQSRD
jgi:hypothetical protein